jgi:pectate lyase
MDKVAISRTCLVMLILYHCAVLAEGAGARKAFPGAEGWAAYTAGGRDGQIIRVTTLAASGPGSFREAVQTNGPRIVVFEVGGVIDLDTRSIAIREPYVTIAGQTAPSPGVTFIRGGLRIETHDVIMRHIRVRPGEAGLAKKSGWDVDAIATSGADAYNIIVDHCSCTWATDENLSASGPRFEGDDVAQWRQGTSRKITFSNCIIAEGLSNSTHAKGEHSKGSLIHDNCTEIAVIANLYAHNRDRNPFFKGGARGIVVNNYIYDPGRRAIHFGLVPGEWGNRPYATGQMAIVGNVLESGPSTRADVTLFRYQGDGPCEIFMQDNRAVDRDGNDVQLIHMDSDAARQGGHLVAARPLWPEGLDVLPASDVKAHVLQNAGARPWDRDKTDRRIVRDALDGTGSIIDSEKAVGGYPRVRPASAPFDPEQWDLTDMTRR